jgi:hypothetical protein
MEKKERTGRSCKVLWAAGRTWALTPRQLGAVEGCGQRMEGYGLHLGNGPCLGNLGKPEAFEKP